MRIDFQTFLKESTENPKKINDVADHFLDGHDAVQAVSKNIENMHKNLLGKKQPMDFHTHYTGTPVEFGTDKTGNFYVAHQGKQNYSFSDVAKNHKKDPELSHKLSTALEELPKILPRKGGVYAGDIIHTKNNRNIKDNQIHLNNDNKTYSINSNGSEGKKIKNSNIGITIHTNVSKGTPVSSKDFEMFSNHPDVHVLDSRIRGDVKHYPLDKQKEFLTHYNLANDSYKGMRENIFDDLSGHTEHIRNYIKGSRTNGEEPSHEGYVEYSKNVSPNHLEQAINMKHHLKKVFQMHNHLNNAKNVLMDIANKNEPYSHKENDEIKPLQRIIGVDKNGEMVKFEKHPEIKKLKEETVTADVGGLGFNTGNPAVPPNITTTNTSDSDQKNNSLFFHLAKEHGTKHNLLKFSSFHVDMSRKPADKKEK